MQLRTISSYVRELRGNLPFESFVPARSRLWWLPVHMAIIATTVWALASGQLPAVLWPVASLVIGCCFGGITFLGHETLHGGVVRGKRIIRTVGFFCLLPFTLAPTLWTAWHNRVHHNHTGQPGVDPDMYPTLEEYESDPRARIMANYFGMGRRRIMGCMSLLFGFTGQCLQMLFTSRRRGFLTAKLHRRAIAESLLGVAIWAALAVLVGPLVFVFAYLLPLVVANTIVMLFIMTNHNLSPLTPINDPLVNSLSVTLPRPLEWLTLGFGYHAEHHLFPSLSTRYGPRIREVLRLRFPERYQSLPMTTALIKLYQTARVYKDNVTLVDPPSGNTWTVLGADNVPH